ncbi:MAG: GTPase Era [Oceanospirillaceae bacterium]|uniref:GTPase Era n=1 Tax=unclassified Thalassolituus TaxID=2624967 RepID=UPI000C0BB5FF|nr:MULTISPECIES: GTPase Era [unclassified Thalassolituus]MAK92376.1 GTPase Era [Thalassolituus sp.]MAS24367.1 GTPase Era [Oceanospirillaceae bacterium]MBL34570.1 GTPase Era [Oceanospirillaceae bacterium]MBS53773.1 GTPase Era [Oceanospirillaceae bacterium]|tara:strand:- start:1405 stop:2301 length:897 start_codon:yes stop_codon:yes gene_type:complete
MTTRTGYVAIVGRPNVGKSTLMNRILGQKLSITSRKPQTTRHQVLGIKTENDVQVVYVDTPGIHKIQEKAINRYMNKAATTAVKDVDLIVLMVDRMRWTDEDEMALQTIKNQRAPVVLVVNKVDFVREKEALLPYLEELSKKHNFDQIVPVSAKTGHNVDRLEQLIESYLPESQYFFPEDQITDRSSRFLAAELVREKIMRQLGDELPYAMTVEIEEFVHSGTLIEISALILVERASQKRIVIGEGGYRIKQIGQDARKDMEELFDCKVMLKLWVKVKANWSDDERALRSLGYDDYSG